MNQITNCQVMNCQVTNYLHPELFDHVDNEDKGVTIRDTLGGPQELTVINEALLSLGQRRGWLIYPILKEVY